MQQTEKYRSGLTKNTLCIICNDCGHMQDFIRDRKFIVATALFNMITPENGFDEMRFRFYLENNKIGQILVAGHCSCQMFRYLSDMESEIPFWMFSRNESELIQKWLNRFAPLKEDNRIKFMMNYLRLQVFHVRELLRKSGLEQEYPVAVDGILFSESGKIVYELKDAEPITTGLFLN